MLLCKRGLEILGYTVQKGDYYGYGATNNKNFWYYDRLNKPIRRWNMDASKTRVGACWDVTALEGGRLATLEKILKTLKEEGGRVKVEGALYNVIQLSALIQCLKLQKGGLR